MAGGRIIFLNGTSSSGKTTISRKLQERLPEPWMYYSLDGLFHLYPERIWKTPNEEDVIVLRRLIPIVVSGFHRAAGGLAAAGNNLIVDHVLENPAWLSECLDQWTGSDVFFVGVKCPLDELERRETERGDRAPGLARYQFDRVHAHGVYDVEVDTSVLDVDSCVDRIMDTLNQWQVPGAFASLAVT
jgi:chloramphenicol 3-O phosphotransferase